MGEDQGNASNSIETLQPFLAPLAALQRLLSRYGDRGLILGGIAVSLLGKPRLTVGVDALLLMTAEQIPEVLKTAREEGLIPRIDNADDFAKKQRVLLLRHQDSGTPIDILLGILPFEEEAVARSQVHQVGSLALRLPTPEDLIILKAVAHRPKVLLDIQTVFISNPNIDKRRIESWVHHFAEALEMPEIWDDLQKLLSQTGEG